jgi:hypothetical protein
MGEIEENTKEEAGSRWSPARCLRRHSHENDAHHGRDKSYCAVPRPLRFLVLPQAKVEELGDLASAVGGPQGDSAPARRRDQRIHAAVAAAAMVSTCGYGGEEDVHR